MIGHSRSLAVILFSNLALALSLSAGPPLLTDDPDTPGPGNWEINVAAELEKGDTDWVWNLPILDINYGVGERIQLKYEIPYVLTDRAGMDPSSGWGGSEVGVKWRFLDEEEDGVSVSTYPQYTFNARQTSINRGLVDDGGEFLLPFQVARTFGPVLVYGEMGFAWLEQGSEEWIYGLAAEYEICESFALLAELNGVAEDGFDHDELFYNVGFKWHVHENVAVIGSVGQSIHEPAGEEALTLSYLGLQLTF